MRPRLRWALKQATPYGVVRWRNQQEERRREALAQRLSTEAGQRVSGQYSFADAHAFLVSRGLDGEQVMYGSMPEPSLRFTSEVLRGRLPSGRAILGLHIGNFVGMSLTHLTAELRALDESSVVISIDPNAKHRGIADPMRHALGLLERYGLLSNSVVITGYSLEQNANETVRDAEAGGEALGRWQAEAACENVLESLVRACGPRFDVVLVDGNHEGGYPIREWQVLSRLLAERAIVIFDDVTLGSWYGVSEAFDRAANDPRGFETLGTDNRVGILQRRG